MKPIMFDGDYLRYRRGDLSLGYHGITYATHERVLQIGTIEATKKTEKIFPLAPLLGGGVVAAGIALIIMGAKK